ncbi:hypothetical protein SAMN04487972_12819 [Paracoccus halophilus]|uniref:Uncharacterized protein n=1 Tax=Paracoccus halophilus TaxID=376733 RepID=A0A1I0UAX6_9RHOB|nr:hypothetical protein SAMN04487972_12819 [Paracoccus halophilus]
MWTAAGWRGEFGCFSIFGTLGQNCWLLNKIAICVIRLLECPSNQRQIGTRPHLNLKPIFFDAHSHGSCKTGRWDARRLVLLLPANPKVRTRNFSLALTGLRASASRIPANEIHGVNPVHGSKPACPLPRAGCCIRPYSNVCSPADRLRKSARRGSARRWPSAPRGAMKRRIASRSLARKGRAKVTMTRMMARAAVTPPSLIVSTFACRSCGFPVPAASPSRHHAGRAPCGQPGCRVVRSAAPPSATIAFPVMIPILP